MAHGARVTKSTLFVTYDFPKRDTNWNGLSLWRMDMFVRHKLDTNVTHKLKFKFFVAHGLSLWRMDPYATTSPNMFVAYGSIRHNFPKHVCGVWIHTPHMFVAYGSIRHTYPPLSVKNLNFFPPLFSLSPYINFTSLTFSPPHSLFFPTLSPLSFLLFLYSIIFLLFTSILHI